MDNVGGSMYWATTAELQSNIPGVPNEYGLKATAFVDAGSVFRYSGPTTFPGSAQSLQLANNNIVRSSVGVGLSWASPFGALTVRLCRAADESRLRRGAADQLRRRAVLVDWARPDDMEITRGMAACRSRPKNHSRTPRPIEKRIATASSMPIAAAAA